MEGDYGTNFNLKGSLVQPIYIYIYTHYEKWGLQPRFKNTAIDPKNAALGRAQATFFKRGFRIYIYIYIIFFKKKTNGSIAAFLKCGLSPTHKNAAQTSKKRGYRADLGLHLLNAAQRYPYSRIFLNAVIARVFCSDSLSPSKRNI